MRFGVRRARAPWPRPSPATGPHPIRTLSLGFRGTPAAGLCGRRPGTSLAERCPFSGPLCCAASSLAIVRSRMRAASYSAKAPRICMNSLPAAVCVSIPSSRLTKATPRLSSSPRTDERCARLLPSLSSLATATASISRRRAAPRSAFRPSFEVRLDPGQHVSRCHGRQDHSHHATHDTRSAVAN